jgi:hypothetical protein
MIDPVQREKVFIERILIVFFFLFIISVFSDHSERLDQKTSNQEICSVLSSASNPADIQIIKVPVLQRNWFTITNRLPILLTNIHQHNQVINCKYASSYIFLQKAQLDFNPAQQNRLYFLLFPDDSGELPFLS